MHVDDYDDNDWKVSKTYAPVQLSIEPNRLGCLPYIFFVHFFISMFCLLVQGENKDETMSKSSFVSNWGNWGLEQEKKSLQLKHNINGYISNGIRKLNATFVNLDLFPI